MGSELTGRMEKFLSHLSGDEELGNKLLCSLSFLSHLSGDEEGMFCKRAERLFLSHLSGDEAPF